MASKSCKELLTVKSRTVFKLFRHRVNASSNSATVTFFIVFKMCRHRVNAVLAYIYCICTVTENVQEGCIYSVNGGLTPKRPDSEPATRKYDRM